MKNPSMERFRQMGDEELGSREGDLRDQLFRLRFQMSTGQSESIKKLRQLRRDIARVKTLTTEREHGAVPSPATQEPARAAKPARPAKKAAAKKPAAKKAAAKKPAAAPKKAAQKPAAARAPMAKAAARKVK